MKAFPISAQTWAALLLQQPPGPPTVLGDLQAQMDTIQPPLAEEQQLFLLIRQKGGKQVDKQVESSTYSKGMQSPPVCVPLSMAGGWHTGRREGEGGKGVVT